MKLLCIFPIVNNTDNITHILKQIKTSIGPKLCSLGATPPLSISFAGMNYTYVPVDQEIQGEPKGKGVLECIKNQPSPPDFVICCDGSNKIPYEYIPLVFQQMISDSSICCVMANRGENRAISAERYLVERFEIFAIARYHNHKNDIPDGQCGLWGFRCGKIVSNGAEKEIKLTADGYEIELDLLSEVLRNGLSYSFIDVNLPKPPIPPNTAFKYANNLTKMRFLLKKHSKLKDCIPGYLEEFTQRKDVSEMLAKKDINNFWGMYTADLLKTAAEFNS